MNHQTQAKAILSDLAGLTRLDALKVLSAAQGLILAQTEKADTELADKLQTDSIHLQRRPGRVSRVDNDPEIKAYLHGLDTYLTLKMLRAALIQKFGKQRVPSKSSLHRYLQKIQKK
jgi:hypothetical protein